MTRILLKRNVNESYDVLPYTKLRPAEGANPLKNGAVLVDHCSRIGAEISMAPEQTNSPLLKLISRLRELPQ